VKRTTLNRRTGLCAAFLIAVLPVGQSAIARAAMPTVPSQASPETRLSESGKSNPVSSNTSAVTRLCGSAGEPLPWPASNPCDQTAVTKPPPAVSTASSGPICGTSPDGPKDKCDRIIAAQQFEAEWRLDKAADAYDAAIPSKDFDIRTLGIDGSNRVKAEMEHHPWVLHRYVWPITWWHRYNRSDPHFFLFLTGLYIVCIAFVLIITVGRVLWSRLIQRTVTVQTPIPANDGAKSVPVILVAEMAAAAAEMSEWRLPAEGVRHQSGGSSALTAPSTAFADVASLPKVYGIDVGSWISAVLNTLKFFTWRFNTVVSAAADEKIILCGDLTWAWWTAYTWQIEAKDVQHAARRMAYLMLSVGYRPGLLWRWFLRHFPWLWRFDGPRLFSSTYCFMNFAEGLRSLQCYQEVLDAKELDWAERCLNECIVQSPTDLLPRYYAGVVRIEQAAILAQGSGTQPTRDRILDEASVDFLYVENAPNAKAFCLSAKYNRATAALYRLSKEGYEEGWKILDEIEKESTASRLVRHNAVGGDGVQDETSEDVLLLQVESLRLFCRARPLWDGIVAGDRETPDKVQADVERFGEQIGHALKVGGRFERVRLDLISDYYYLLGHVQRGFAVIAKDDNRQSHYILAAKYFEEALTYQPRWVPPLVNLRQVYEKLGDQWQHEFDRIKELLPVWPVPAQSQAMPATAAPTAPVKTQLQGTFSVSQSS
jgi:hypothetical protein